jgi:hypothetical protein
MPLSGTAPNYDISTSPDQSTTLANVAGAVTGAAANAYSNETLQNFYRRALGVLVMSGALAVSGGTSGGSSVSGLQCFAGSVISGIRNLQQELALRAADIEYSGNPSASRITLANTILTGSGEVVFGT